METTLEGRWQMVRAELAGEAAPDMFAEQTTMWFARGAYEVWFGNEVADQGNYLEEPAQAHRRLVLHGTKGANAGREIPCIFQLVGDRLRVCYGLDGVMPAGFATRAGEQRYLVVYRRVGE